MKPDYERVRQSVTEAVIMLCKNGLHHQDTIKIEGVLAITLDDNLALAIHINQLFENEQNAFHIEHINNNHQMQYDRVPVHEKISLCHGKHATSSLLEVRSPNADLSDCMTDMSESASTDMFQSEASEREMLPIEVDTFKNSEQVLTEHLNESTSVAGKPCLVKLSLDKDDNITFTSERLDDSMCSSLDSTVCSNLDTSIVIKQELEESANEVLADEISIVPISNHEGSDSDHTVPVRKKRLASKKCASINKMDTFKCYICPQSFMVKQSLFQHLDAVHSKTPLKCHFCDKTFSTKHAGYQHIRVKHLRDCKHQCTICPAMFRNVTDLEGHLNAHKGISPYMCDRELCGKSFTNKRNLQAHVKYVHDVDSFTLSCPHCQRRFGKQCTVNKHLKTCKKAASKKNHTTNICDESTYNKSDTKSPNTDMKGVAEVDKFLASEDMTTDIGEYSTEG